MIQTKAETYYGFIPEHQLNIAVLDPVRELLTVNTYGRKTAVAHLTKNHIVVLTHITYVRVKHN